MKKLKFLIKSCIFICIIFAVILLGLYVYARITPKFDIKNSNSIVLLDNSDSVFFESNGSSSWASLGDISPYFIKATIAAEDKNFYKHFGFDFLRIVKAMYVNIKTGSKKQGASTITQQYARNLYLSMDKTWSRKIEEAWLSFKMEIDYSKDEILEGYVNTINYGHGNYGIENASQFYFNKNSKDLDLAEASILAGIPKSPSNYSPITDLIEAKKRQKIILSMMVKNGFITQKEADDAFNEELTFIGKKEKLNLDTLMYYEDAVMKELSGITSIPSSLISTGGLKIYTNFDSNAQTILEEAIDNNISVTSSLQVSSVIIEPSTGKIIALAGGRDYNTSQFNRVTQSKRQIGSTMKPFLYYAALENGFTPSSVFKSEETIFTFSDDSTYAPKNYAEKYANKNISLAAALAYSDNIYAIKTHLFLGEETLVDISQRVGIATKLNPIPSLPLGTIEINILDLLSGYNTLANEGVKVDNYLIRKVVDKYGNTLYEHKDNNDVVLNKSLVFILNELLTGTYDVNLIDVLSPTCVSLASSLTKKYSLKSGSTNTDVWAIGYNKDILVGVWTGYDDNSDVEGSDRNISKSIWSYTVENFLLDKDVSWYEMPNNVVGVLVNPVTGNIATNEDKNKKILYYLKGTEPTT